MTDLPQSIQFIKFWFSQPYVKETGASFRLSYLPSAFQEKTFKVKVFPKEIVLSPDRVALEPERVAEEIEAVSSRGYNVYYFINPVRDDAPEFARNVDVTRRIFLALDLDYRLPVSIADLEKEIGLSFTAVIETSKREFARHQLLLAMSEWNAEMERGCDTADPDDLPRRWCAAFGSDPVHDPKRIFRLPGTMNWKGVESAEDAKLVKIVKLAGSGVAL
jgi:hypothetical protein